MARKINFDPAPSHEREADQASSLPASAKSRPLLGMERSIKQSSALGAISQSLGGMTDKVKRADEIEQKLIEGQVIIELEPSQIDNSFVADRMDASEEQSTAFRELIREHGQNVPILVRPKAGNESRYEVAFGHRRLRAARELGIKVRAVVRQLSDEQLVIAQGQENSGRTDLTFIERARFAARLEDRKFTRETIMAALAVDKAALSRLIAVARRVPAEIIESIGPAPAYGRVRWQELTELLEQQENRSRAKRIVSQSDFASLDSDKRFEALLSDIKTRPARVQSENWSTADGTQAARISRGSKRLTMVFDDRTAPKFGDYVKGRLQALYDEFKAENSSA